MIAVIRLLQRLMHGDDNHHNSDEPDAPEWLSSQGSEETKIDHELSHLKSLNKKGLRRPLW